MWVQAPEHVIENRRAEAKAASDPVKRRKLVKKKPPEHNYAHYDGDTLSRLWHGQPETLDSSFAVTHSMMLNVLDRPGDGCAAMKRLLIDNHEPRTRQRAHIRRAVGVFRSLIDAEIVEVLDEPDHLGRPVRVNLDLQDEFRLNQPLGLFAVEALEALDVEAPDYHWQALSVVESVLEDPTAVLLAQRDKARDDLMAQLKAERVPYEERLERLSEVTWPRPEAEFIEPSFAVFARVQPLGGPRPPQPQVGGPRPHGGGRHLQPVRLPLRHQALRGRCVALSVRLLQGPSPNRPRRCRSMTPWPVVTAELGTLLRTTDSSLLDEWESLRNG